MDQFDTKLAQKFIVEIESDEPSWDIINVIVDRLRKDYPKVLVWQPNDSRRYTGWGR